MTFSQYLAHTDPLFKDLEIMPIDKMIIDRIGITMFKVTYELVPKSILPCADKTLYLMFRKLLRRAILVTSLISLHTLVIYRV